jgi:hypothetical protein
LAKELVTAELIRKQDRVMYSERTCIGLLMMFLRVKCLPHETTQSVPAKQGFIRGASNHAKRVTEYRLIWDIHPVK